MAIGVKVGSQVQKMCCGTVFGAELGLSRNKCLKSFGSFLGYESSSYIQC